jgi:Protein of unknown function (DUF1479)
MSAAVTAEELIGRAGRNAGEVADLLAELRASVASQAELVRAASDAGEPVYPEVAMADVLAGMVPAGTLASIRATGCAIVRGTFERSVAEEWDAELGEYLARNAFRTRLEGAVPEAATGSRIWGVYWSRPQVQARQHDRMVAVRRFLNTLWRHESCGRRWFDPDDDIGYPDRVRRREPGAVSRGLGCHGDAPAVGGWRYLENQLVFADLLAGGPGSYDPWDAAHRTTLADPSIVGTTVFRTFQGWTALSEMQPADGVLHVAPILDAVAYRYVAGLAGELGVGEGAGAVPGPAPHRDHGDDLVRSALVPIPAIEPGDSVWWHGDLFHAVADAANATRWGNVMYIGSAPVCERNDAYRSDLFERFVAGRSPRDFPADDFEVDFDGRATPADLSAVGRRQFGPAR